MIRMCFFNVQRFQGSFGKSRPRKPEKLHAATAAAGQQPLAIPYPPQQAAKPAAIPESKPQKEELLEQD